MGKLYVLCSNKLDPVYAAVQGGHAIAEYLTVQEAKNPRAELAWHNETVVYLSVDVRQWHDYLESFTGIWWTWAAWREPDVGNEITSIAICIPEDATRYVDTNVLQIQKDHKELLKRLKREKLLSLHFLHKI